MFLHIYTSGVWLHKKLLKIELNATAYLPFMCQIYLYSLELELQDEHL